MFDGSSHCSHFVEFRDTAPLYGSKKALSVVYVKNLSLFNKMTKAKSV